MDEWFMQYTQPFQYVSPPPRVPKPAVDVNTLRTWPELYADEDNQYYYNTQAYRMQEFMEGECPTAAPVTINATFNNKIVLYQGDITTLKCDAIVNAANTGLWSGGGVCGAIHAAAGPVLARACTRIGRCNTGDTVITRGYKLPAKYVLHTVGPTNKSADELRSCYRTILDRCVEYGIRSVSICAVSTGVYGFPSYCAAFFALETIRDCFESDVTYVNAIDRLVLCTFTPEDTEAYAGFVQYLFPLNTAMESLTAVSLVDDDGVVPTGDNNTDTNDNNTLSINNDNIINEEQKDIDIETTTTTNTLLPSLD